MSFVGKAIKSVVGFVSNTLGSLFGASPKAPALPAPAAAPTVANSSAQLDAAAQTAAAGLQRGRTSTLLTGGNGEDENKLNTSKVLLGQ